MTSLLCFDQRSKREGGCGEEGREEKFSEFTRIYQNSTVAA
jgi:hypothetical protein